MFTPRKIVWQALAWTATEYFELDPVQNGYVAKSFITGLTAEGQPIALTYRVELTSDWQIKKVGVWGLADVTQRIILLHDLQGQWFDENGKHLIQLDGCQFIDISLSPFTNTIPIKRLSFQHSEKQAITVAYIDALAFSARKVTQYYSHNFANIYRYQDGEVRNFKVDLRLDEDGLVVKYPKLFNRIYPRK